jgi:hypothetical protein
MTTLPFTLRRLAAHLDESDPTRKPGRRPGTTISPYACDFEIDEETLNADIQAAAVSLAAMLPGSRE